MPGYKGHLLGGCAAFCFGLFLLASSHPTNLTMFEWFLCAISGSLFPDVDVKSKGQNLFYKIMLAVLLLLFAQGKVHIALMIGILALIPMIVRHRGIFHRLWFVIIMPYAIAWSLAAYYPFYARVLLLDTTFFVLGAVSHLWLDLGLRRMVRL